MTIARPDPRLNSNIINGTPVWKGVIIATTTKNNHDTATPFLNTGDAMEGGVYLLEASAACNVNCAGTTNAVTASVTRTSSSYGFAMAADERVIITMAEGYKWIAVVGAASVVVWELK